MKFICGSSAFLWQFAFLDLEAVFQSLHWKLIRLEGIRDIPHSITARRKKIGASIQPITGIQIRQLPNISETKAECSRIDECQDWADRAEALASYAKQSKDDGLRRLAARIQARPIRRCGELLKTFDARGRPPENNNGTVVISQSKAAKDAGLSQRQKETAVRVANVPDEDFEEAVESEHPPTVTALAEQGKKPRLFDLGGRDPKEFSISTDGQGQIHKLAQFTEDVEPGVVVRGAMPYEREMLIRDITSIEFWFDELMVFFCIRKIRRLDFRMPGPGRPRMPTLVHKMTGSAKKNPDRMKARENEPTDIPDLGEAPDYLSEFERDAWNDITSKCPDGVLRESDEQHVAIAARLWAARK